MKTAILDSNGNTVVKYTYNAWGYHTVSDTSGNSLGTKNPFRYRSYFYDTETKLYYLKTRYYDPEVGRFINMDSVQYANPEAVNGLNLYAYCNNNPVMNVDPDGTNWFSEIGNFFKNLSDGLSKLGKKIINLFNFSNKGVGDDFSFDISGETGLGSNSILGGLGNLINKGLNFLTNYTVEIIYSYSDTIWNGILGSLSRSEAADWIIAIGGVCLEWSGALPEVGTFLSVLGLILLIRSKWD